MMKGLSFSGTLCEINANRVGKGIHGDLGFVVLKQTLLALPEHPSGPCFLNKNHSIQLFSPFHKIIEINKKQNKRTKNSRLSLTEEEDPWVLPK